VIASNHARRAAHPWRHDHPSSALSFGDPARIRNPERTVNAWVRTSHAFDGVNRLRQVCREPDPTPALTPLRSGDPPATRTDPAALANCHAITFCFGF